jgi:hypothetical protein
MQTSSNPAVPVNPGAGEKFTVTGTVIDATTGEPVHKALVQLNGIQRRTTFTDSGGRFQFEGVPAGGVSLAAQKPGYFSEQEMARASISPLDVGPNSAPAVVKLFPEAVVFGKVTTVDGVPLEHVSMTLTRLNFRDGQRHWDNQGSTNTDEDGHFRFANLRPGSYYLAAAPYSPLPENLLETDQPPTTGYRGAYYNGAPDVASASPLQLNPGQRSEANFSLIEVAIYRLSGIVSGYAANQGVGLQVLDQSGMQVPVDVEFNTENGRFDVRGLPAGSYVLKAISQSGPNQNVRAEVRFNLAGDLHNLHLALLPAIAIPVIVSMDSEPSAERWRRPGTGSYPSGPPVAVRLIGNGPGATDVFASFEGQPDQQKLIFRSVDPGRYSAVIDAQGSSYVASAEYGQTNLLTDDLVISAGAPAQSLNIALRNDSASLAGTVQVPEGWTHPVSVIAISEDAAKRSPRVGNYFPTRDNRAEPTQFNLGALAPGNYLVFAFDHLDDVEYSNSDVLQKYTSLAAHVTLLPNQRAHVTLELIRAEGASN